MKGLSPNAGDVKNGLKTVRASIGWMTEAVAVVDAN